MACIGFANGCHCQGCMGPELAPTVTSDYDPRDARIAALEAALQAARKDAGLYLPFVEMVASCREPRAKDQVDAMEIIRELKRAALSRKEPK